MENINIQDISDDNRSHSVSVVTKDGVVLAEGSSNKFKGAGQHAAALDAYNQIKRSLKNARKQDPQDASEVAVLEEAQAALEEKYGFSSKTSLKQKASMAFKIATNIGAGILIASTLKVGLGLIGLGLAFTIPGVIAIAAYLVLARVAMAVFNMAFFDKSGFQDFKEKLRDKIDPRIKGNKTSYGWSGALVGLGMLLGVYIDTDSAQSDTQFTQADRVVADTSVQDTGLDATTETAGAAVAAENSPFLTHSDLPADQPVLIQASLERGASNFPAAFLEQSDGDAIKRPPDIFAKAAEGNTVSQPAEVTAKPATADLTSPTDTPIATGVVASESAIDRSIAALTQPTGLDSGADLQSTRDALMGIERGDITDMIGDQPPVRTIDIYGLQDVPVYDIDGGQVIILPEGGDLPEGTEIFIPKVDDYTRMAIIVEPDGTVMVQQGLLSNTNVTNPELTIVTPGGAMIQQDLATGGTITLMPGDGDIIIAQPGENLLTIKPNGDEEIGPIVSEPTERIPRWKQAYNAIEFFLEMTGYTYY